MNDIRVASGTADGMPEHSERRFVPMKIGDAVVYVEATDASTKIESDGEIRPVGLDPKEAFEKAVGVIQECVRVVGDKVESITNALKPQELKIEFSITFDASGKASVIPIFVTGEAKVSTGLKVTATWKPSEK